MRQKKPNLIILTPGLSGSSVITSLISNAGYFLGKNTAKIEYDTFENKKLVEHNITLFKQTGFMWRDPGDLPPPSIEKMKELHKNIDLNPYRDFIKECDESSPWIWKDPRLSYTMFFWKELLNLENCKFIHITREIRQIWTGVILRVPLPVSFKNLQTVHGNTINSAEHFLDSNSINALKLELEDLLINPDSNLEKINSFLDINLSIDDFKRVYNGKLYKKRWSPIQQAKAHLYFYLFKAAGKEIKFPRHRHT